MIVLAENVKNTLLSKTPKYQRVYLSLQYLGKPSHFEDIYNAYHQLFPEDQLSSHNIHAILTRIERGIVWIGIKGTYALEEWGYKRPDYTLFNTVVLIVWKKYLETGKPVPYSVIMAEIGKYRPLVNPNSMIFATSFNPGITQIDNCFLPRKEDDKSNYESNEELDLALEEFEKQIDKEDS